MLLVDDVLEFDQSHIKTRTVISESSPFFQPGRGMPSYVTFEIMAQSISAYDGAIRRDSGEPPAIGFLLGCRKFQTMCDWLQAGDSVITEAKPLLAEGEMQSFDCSVKTDAGLEIALGIINVYRPEDPIAFLSQV